MKMARETGLADRLPSLLLEDGRTLMEMGSTCRLGMPSTRRSRAKAAPDSRNSTSSLDASAPGWVTRRGTRALEEAKRMAEASAADVAPRLDAAFGERAYARRLIKDGARAFRCRVRKWVDEWPDAASVSARAYEGFIDGMDRRADGLASSPQASNSRRA
jgi:hypothetical protein